MLTHRPVLLNEAIDQLAVQAGGRYVDATVGGGGHTAALLVQSQPNGEVLALDRDRSVLAAMQRRTDIDQHRLHLAHASSADLGGCLVELGWPAVDGIIADLGISSMQLDDPGRGFSYRVDGPLDLRFDQAAGQPAWQLLRGWRERELADILAIYGDLRFPAALARRIRAASERRLIRTTAQLITASGLKHPSRRAQLFQALRIAVNDELGTLERSLPEFWQALANGGRVAIISFHSGEHRRVKQFFQEQVRLGAGQLLTKKAIRSGRAELAANPRSRSAQLRVIEKRANSD